MRKILYLVAMISAVALLSAAYAYHHNYGMLGAKMGDMDGNDDGVITYEEFDQYYSKNVRAIFDALDSDKDGTISSEEWKIFLDIHGVDSGHMSYKNG